MRVYAPDGSTAPMARTEAKKAHDPDEVKRINAALKALYKECLEGFARDMRPNGEGPELITPDYHAVRDHWAGKWNEQAKAFNATGFPHPIDEEAVRKSIEEGHEAFVRQQAMSRPMHEVDLAPYELLPVGRIRTGVLHLSDVCAVSVSDTGLCLVWVRKPGEDLEDWAARWMPQPERLADVEAVAYTLQELHALLSASRIARIAALPEGLMSVARTPIRRNWWQKAL